MKKRILIVDDDKSFLTSLTEGLADELPDSEIIAAGDGDEAVTILEQGNVDLLVTDLKMPKMDGFELLAYVSSHLDDLPIIVFTAHGTAEIEQKVEKLGAVRYLEKPIDIDLLQRMIENTINDRPHGYISGVSVSAFLQLLELEKKSCTLNLTSGKHRALIAVDSGRIVSASASNLTGMNAIIKIIGWRNTSIEILSDGDIVERNIDAPITEALLEALRIKDEEQNK